jgi:hypothetical protein
MRSFLIAGLLALGLTGPSQAAAISVFASGTLESSPFTTGPTNWTFSGSFSDSLTDALGANPGGAFEFEPSDLATLDFSIGGTSIDFLAPTPHLLDSRINLFSGGLSFSLFLDPTDPFFGPGYTNTSFIITLLGGPFASDLEDLTTLGTISNTAVSSAQLVHRASGSSFFRRNDATGSISLQPAAVVPLPATLPLLAGGLVLFGVLGSRKRKQSSA